MFSRSGGGEIHTRLYYTHEDSVTYTDALQLLLLYTCRIRMYAAFFGRLLLSLCVNLSKAVVVDVDFTVVVTVVKAVRVNTGLRTQDGCGGRRYAAKGAGKTRTKAEDDERRRESGLYRGVKG